jgi:hypothetical protein
VGVFTSSAPVREACLGLVKNRGEFQAYGPVVESWE